MPGRLTFPHEHPLKAELKSQRIPLWRLRKELGGSPSEFKLCRMLNGIEALSLEFEKRIREVLDNHDQDFAGKCSEHPLKKELLSRIGLPDLKKFKAGGLPDFDTIVKMLDGDEVMPKDVEESLYEVCSEWDRGLEAAWEAVTREIGVDAMLSFLGEHIRTHNHSAAVTETNR